VEQAIETAAMILRSDKSRGYCLEMICADLLAGANLDQRDPELLLKSVAGRYKFLPGGEKHQFLTAATEIFTTTIAEAEIFYGIELLAKSKRREQLLAAAEAMFVEDLGRILAFDGVATRAFSRIAAQRRGLGRPIAHADTQIAAIAQARGARPATRNIADLADRGVDLIDPWSTS
jgi:predicted nucleic acid-binding protein